MCSRRIQMEGPVYNTRDLGGIQTADGRVIREHCLLRSGALGKCTEEDIRTLTKRYELRTVVDLRTTAEREEAPDPEITGVTFCHNPVFNNAMLGITREGQSQMGSFTDMIMGFMKDAGENPGEKMGQIYPKMVSDQFCLNQISHFFQILLEQKNGAVLWHCTAGKDRVGTTTALLLAALGVERETIIQDYLMTNVCLQPETDSLVSALSQRIQNPNILELIRTLNGVDRRYIEAVFSETEKQCGNVGNFLEKKLGITAEKRNALQKKYLVSATTSH